MTETRAPETARGGLPLGSILAVIGLLALLALLGAGLVRTNQSQPTSGGAPDFTLTLYERYDGGYGRSLTLSQLRGKVVIVNFWASWCVPCRDEADLLELTWRQYKDQGLVLVGIGYNDTETEALKYLQEFGITYPNGPDLRNAISPKYHIQGVPETFFVDRDGNIVHTEIGPLSQAKMNQVLGPLMK
jgi:cytochrome c biogenesis protein CcmG/thiol:disulfide interchange protein DsbE